MLKLLTSNQVKALDHHTIQNQSISSVDLMEMASAAFIKCFKCFYPDKEKLISIYCGTGNNGGDGLAIGRLLYIDGYKNLNLKVVRFTSKCSNDFLINYNRATALAIPVLEIHTVKETFAENAELIIDAIFGSGLNKPLEGEWKALVIWLNSLNKFTIAVDVPTGFKAEGVIKPTDTIIQSQLTITFQRPKINFLLPESADFIKQFEVVDIGLDEHYIQSLESPYELLTDEDISIRLKKRGDFSHKGTYGHALIVAGALETMGAALLCAEASLHTGSGLTTACIPAQGLTALNTRIPEVMALVCHDHKLPADINWEKYSSVAVGPGLGTSQTAKVILEATLRNFKKPKVFDADALNLISTNPEFFKLIPKGSIFTPHVKEFDRLFGVHEFWWERLQTGIAKAKLLNCYILLKNRYSIIFTPAGKCFFNNTGTPAMATGGMGDVLTGMIASFLAQGYTPEDAIILATFLHGKAGENYCKKEKAAVVPAALLIKEISKTIFLLTR